MEQQPTYRVKNEDMTILLQDAGYKIFKISSQHQDLNFQTKHQT